MGISRENRKIKAEEGEIPCGCKAAKFTFFGRHDRQKYQVISEERVLTGAAVALLLFVFVRDRVLRTGVTSSNLLFGQ